MSNEEHTTTIEIGEKARYADDRRDLIEKILQFQDLDSLLRLSVVLCDLELAGAGCSLFLRNHNDLELKESTRVTRFIGQPLNLERERAEAAKIRALLHARGQRPEALDRTLTREQVEAWSGELVESLSGFGLTRWAVQFRCPMVIDRIHEDIRWSGSKEGSSSALRHCELDREEIGSIAIATLGDQAEGLPRGVVRVVRRTTSPSLGPRELEWMRWLAGQMTQCIEVAESLTELMDVGARLSYEDFGASLVQLLRKVLKARGCSIFLEVEPASGPVRSFQCIATTGLFRGGRSVPQGEAFYEVDTSQNEVDSLTGWVLRNGRHLAVDSSSEFDPTMFEGLTRKPGPGKFSESDPDDEHQPPGGPLLIAPLFLHQGREPVGAIRLARPGREAGRPETPSPVQIFEDHEKLLFHDISRRLSRALTNLNFREVSEKLIELYDQPQEMLRQVPLEVSRLLGVEGCSVFRLRSGRFLELAATKGRLESEVGKTLYDIQVPDQRGWTGWVARYRRSLLFNSPAGGDRLEHQDKPRHTSNYKRNNCEVDGPAFRFLAVPIFRSPEDSASEVLGVIRAPRLEGDPEFLEDVHLSILESFAARLSLALNMAHRAETLREVATLIYPPEDQANGQHDPATLATEVIRRALDVAIDRIGLEQVAVYRLDRRNDTLSLIDGRPVSENSQVLATPPPVGDGYHEVPMQLGGLRLGCIIYRARGEGPTERQLALIGLVAGACASALYNEAVFGKLDRIRSGLVQVGEEITSDSPLLAKLSKIADVAAEVTLADTVIIHEFLAPPTGGDVATGQFRESAWGGAAEPREWKTQFKPGAVPYKVVQRTEALFASDASASATVFHKKEDENFIQREGIRSVAALPLNASGTCVGCIFFNFKRAQDFRANQVQEIQMMAEYAAVAIYQERLLNETRALVQAKSNLLRYADHSLAQPLNALLGYLGGLARGVYYSRLGFENLESASAFRSSTLGRDAEQQYKLCKYMVYLVKTFLRIEAAESDRLFEIEVGEGKDLSEVCEHAVSIAEAYLGGPIERQIEFGVLGCFDADAVEMAILNVLVNAVKHGRGRVGQATRIRLRLAAAVRNGERRAAVQIDDAGPGVVKSERDAIFERGYKRYQDSPGLGIGLFLTRGYIEAHRGRIEVEKSELSGACFRMHLPLDLVGGAV